MTVRTQEIDSLLEEQLHDLWLTIASSIVQSSVLVVVNGIQVGLGFQESINAAHLAISAGKVQRSPAFLILLVLVCSSLKQLLQCSRIACTMHYHFTYYAEEGGLHLPRACAFPKALRCKKDNQREAGALHDLMKNHT